MALIKCYECGKEFSSSSPRCIHCGAVDKSQWWVGFFAVGLVAFLFMAITGLALALPGWGIGLFMSLSIMVYMCFRPWPHTPWVSHLKTKKTAKKKTAKKSVLKECWGIFNDSFSFILSLGLLPLRLLHNILESIPFQDDVEHGKSVRKKPTAKKKKTAKKKTVKKSSTKKSV